MLYQVDYDDCGKEDVDRGTLWDHVVYHPRLETDLFDVEKMPSIGQGLMFAHELQPRFGVVHDIIPTSKTPISIILWKPNAKAKSILRARFVSTALS